MYIEAQCINEYKFEIYYRSNWTTIATYGFLMSCLLQFKLAQMLKIGIKLHGNEFGFGELLQKTCGKLGQTVSSSYWLAELLKVVFDTLCFGLSVCFSILRQGKMQTSTIPTGIFWRLQITNFCNQTLFIVMDLIFLWYFKWTESWLQVILADWPVP